MALVPITDIKPAPRPANTGTLRGAQLLAQSLEECGAGRSIVVDKDNQIIAGQHVFDQAVEMGLTHIDIVESTGQALVAVKRTDLEANEPQAVLLARFDNRVGEVNLQWDGGQLTRDLQDGIELTRMWFDTELSHLIVDDLTEEVDALVEAAAKKTEASLLKEIVPPSPKSPESVTEPKPKPLFTYKLCLLGHLFTREKEAIMVALNGRTLCHSSLQGGVSGKDSQ